MQSLLAPVDQGPRNDADYGHGPVQQDLADLPARRDRPHHVVGGEAVCRVVKYHRSESRTCWDITVEYVDWDGDRCGLETNDVTSPSNAPSASLRCPSTSFHTPTPRRRSRRPRWAVSAGSSSSGGTTSSATAGSMSLATHTSSSR
ncbi:hypothetical protein VTI74DRAFT_570 [Chaetomium olivicolor]